MRLFLGEVVFRPGSLRERVCKGEVVFGLSCFGVRLFKPSGSLWTTLNFYEAVLFNIILSSTKPTTRCCSRSDFMRPKILLKLQFMYQFISFS